MRTTLVIRGEEWLSSLPIHIELFKVLGFPLPRYGHNCSIQKLDGENRRKLSKRKDPEASLNFYRETGLSAACRKRIYDDAFKFEFRRMAPEKSGRGVYRFQIFRQ